MASLRLEEVDILESTCDKPFRRPSIFLFHIRIQTAAIDADSHDTIQFRRRTRHFPYIIEIPHVAWIYPYASRTALQGAESQIVVEMNVRHDRQRAAAADFAEILQTADRWHGDTDNVASKPTDSFYLRQCAFQIIQMGIRHCLDRDWCATANGHSAQHDLSCLSHCSLSSGFLGIKAEPFNA